MYAHTCLSLMIIVLFLFQKKMITDDELYIRKTDASNNKSDTSIFLKHLLKSNIDVSFYNEQDQLHLLNVNKYRY